MFEWWNALGLASQIFYCIAIPATLILLIQTVLMLVGIGDEFDTGADADIPDDIETDFSEVDDMVDISDFDGLRIFTIRGIIAFLVVFGWVGVLMNSLNAQLWITILVAFVCGFLMMVLVAFLLSLVMKLRNDGNIDNKNALGTSGKVYLTIPASRRGEGKVQIMIQGSFVERNAVTDSEDDIPTGSEVVVIGTSGQTDLVVRKK